ncbi:MAG: tRNA uridine-5-carboxymethylaminomethyl(34) synthesis GTPase MnmE [Elusimicrobiaceae bacterium]|nr:tRNA uridine-5-carboxymethylaminomethyl(34) synthesis GTPase MnmE [Elusimicrobiaceae bacterium]
MYNMGDTIVAFATSNGGAIAVLRLSGTAAYKILTKLTKKEDFITRQATFVTIYDGKDILDKALITVFQAPKSYTGEDLIEISLHAGPYIKSRILELCLNYGARMAKAGEFSQRAFLNGKIDLVEAQGVLDIISAKNKAAHNAAVNSLEGRLSGRFKQIRQELTDLLAQIEVRIDDTDGEMQDLPQESTKNTLLKIAKETQNLADTFSSGRLIKDGIKVALCGLTNAGKSSLLNKLLGYNRAIVSSQAGTTRDTVEAPLSLLGFDLVLVDTAGIRQTITDEAEKEGITRSRQAIEQADITIFVRDLTLNDKTEENKFFDEVSKSAKNLITVYNKTDIENCEVNGIKISAKTGQGLKELEEEIINTLNLNNIDGQELIITSAEHYKALLSAALELEKASEKLSDLELCAEHLRSALKYLKELIGEVTTEDILDVIFSKFCVGK